MGQSKKQSILESIVNVVSGLVISFIIQLILYPLLGVPLTLQQNFIASAVFLIFSMIRSYVVRRIFNNIKEE